MSPEIQPGEAAAVETTAHIAHFSRLQKEMLNIYLSFFSSFLSPYHAPPCLSFLMSPHFLLISISISLFPCPFLSLSLTLSLMISVFPFLFTSSCVSTLISLGLSSTITGGHAKGRVLSSWSLVQASRDMSSSSLSAWIDLSPSLDCWCLGPHSQWYTVGAPQPVMGMSKQIKT